MTRDKASRRSVTRRDFLGTSAKAVAAGTVAGAFPGIAAAADPIRTIGLGVSIINEIQGQAGKDLGFNVRGQALGYGAMFSKMLNQNDQYEIAEGYYNDMDVMWPAKVWQPIDTQRIKDWDKVTNLSKTGKLTPESTEGQGDAVQSFLCSGLLPADLLLALAQGVEPQVQGATKRALNDGGVYAIHVRTLDGERTSFVGPGAGELVSARWQWCAR